MKELNKSIQLLLLSVLAFSMFASLGFIKTAQATVGSHLITATYYQAYIHNDHEGVGPGDWYFKLTVPGTSASSGEYSREDPGYVNFADLTRSWSASSGTQFWTWAGEQDVFGIWDYESELTVSMPFPWSSVNTDHYNSYRVGDVTHFYYYRIRNLSPTVGSIIGATSGYRLVAYTFSTPGSDPEGDSITYEWRVDGVLQAATGASLTYTFGTGASIGSHTITVRTKDHFGAYSGTATKTITLSNRSPTVGSISGPTSGYRLVAYAFSTPGSDPDGDSITYEWKVDGALQSETGASLTYTFGAGASLGSHTITVRTKDSFGAYSGTATKAITISNQAPAIGSVSGPTSGFRLVYYAFSTSGSDPEGDPITYEWKVDGALQPDTGSSLTYTFEAGASIGSHTITVRAKDSFDAYSTTATKAITISNQAPAIGSISAKYACEDDPVTFSAPTVTDPEGDAIIAYEWEFGDGETSTVKNPTHTYAEEEKYTVGFRAQDSLGTWSSKTTATVIVSPTFTVAWGKDTFEIDTMSNSYPLKDFAFNQPQKQISFTVSGDTGTPGWCEVTVENIFLGGPYEVWVDGSFVTPTVTTPRPGYSTIRFTYEHSEHDVAIVGETVVPEFPTIILWVFLIIATIAAAVLSKKIAPRKRERPI